MDIWTAYGLDKDLYKQISNRFSVKEIQDQLWIAFTSNDVSRKSRRKKIAYLGAFSKLHNCVDFKLSAKYVRWNKTQLQNYIVLRRLSFLEIKR